MAAMGSTVSHPRMTWHFAGDEPHTVSNEDLMKALEGMGIIKFEELHDKIRGLRDEVNRLEKMKELWMAISENIARRRTPVQTAATTSAAPSPDSGYASSPEEDSRRSSHRDSDFKPSVTDRDESSKLAKDGEEKVEMRMEKLQHIQQSGCMAFDS